MSDDDWNAVQLNSLFLLDSGLSFSDVLLYSHEWDLLSFELLIFLVIDLVSHNYILAIVITFLLSKASKCWTLILLIVYDCFSFVQAVSLIRDWLGKRNLGKKTLIDGRFLI